MRLGLGTVQFGLDYGISNRRGKVPHAEVRRILSAALAAGVNLLDTASAYGDSERVVGECLPAGSSFRIVTKTPPLTDCDAEEGALRWRTALRESLDKLRQASLYGVLVHRINDVLGRHGERLMDELYQSQADGLVEKVGVSIYCATELDEVLHRFKIDLVQIPLSVLDQRLLRSGHLKKLKALNIEVHIRSAFLQGILLSDPGALPSYFDPIRPVLLRYHSYMQQNGLSAVEAAVAFLASVPEVDYAIVGVTSLNEWREIMSATEQPSHALEFDSFAVESEAFVNPSLWPSMPRTIHA
jgi:aryl-alcohol dehydrogenase-like predicted oxidoreductase